MAQKIQPNDLRITIANPSVRTITERNKFAAQLDDFATFNWANTDMFANFGAFIINEKKGSLKLYNGPSYKNNYSKPQFQDGYTNLTGVTFDTQTINFTIGVYWISIEDYRILMNLLHPYEVSMLCFSFEPTYGYFCKLQSIKDSTRYIVGKETIVDSQDNSDKLKYSNLSGGNEYGYRYYTELNLTFDVIGAQCAKERLEQIIDPTRPRDSEESSIINVNTDGVNSRTTVTISFNKDFNHCYSWFISDLDYPFNLTLPYIILRNPQQSGDLTLTAKLTYYDTNNNPNISESSPTVVNMIDLFNITLKNINSNTPISLTYNSEHGLIYWNLGNQTKILTLLSTQSNGQRLISSINSNSFYWPGQLNMPDIKDHYKFELILTASDNLQINIDNTDIDAIKNSLQLSYTARRRTNII